MICSCSKVRGGRIFHMLCLQPCNSDSDSVTTSFLSAPFSLDVDSKHVAPEGSCKSVSEQDSQVAWAYLCTYDRGICNHKVLITCFVPCQSEAVRLHMNINRLWVDCSESLLGPKIHRTTEYSSSKKSFAFGSHLYERIVKYPEAQTEHDKLCGWDSTCYYSDHCWF